MARAAKKASKAKSQNTGRVNLRSSRTKAPAVRTPRSVDERYTGAEPVWTGWETWGVDHFMREMNRARNYYNYFHSGKDLKPHVIEWMRNAGYSKVDISWFRASRDTACEITLGTIAACLLRGMPSRHPDADAWVASRPGLDTVADCEQWLRAKIEALMAKGREAQAAAHCETKVTSNETVSVQDRVREQCYTLSEHIDAVLEQHLTGTVTEKSRFSDLFATHSVSQAHARVLKEMYQPQLDEMVELFGAKRKDDMYVQLVEGYASYSRAALKRRREALEQLIAACDMIKDAARANRKPRIKRPPSKEKQVSKLKYCATDAKYNLASVNPVEILNARELWVFNVKTRKIGVYIADKHSTSLGIKGTAIVGFDTTLSVQKTVRKPEEKLREFKNAGKVALRRFLQNIKGVEVKLNGRINADTVLLKASG